MGKTEVPNPRTKPPSSSQPLEELIKQQGVEPATDLEQLGALWPGADDIDAFDAFIQQQRFERRQNVRG